MIFKELLKELNLQINEVQEEQFNKYYNKLIEVNQVMNLTAITEEQEVYIKHFYDSLTLSKALENKNITLCDVGSGAGFPSIPLAIMFPQMKITIIDALNKRINFLKEVISQLNLTNVEAIHARAEDFVKTKRNYFDVVSARAVANLPVLCELCMPLTKKGGAFVAMKGSNASEEIKQAENAISVLGGKVKQIYDMSLPLNMGERSIIYIYKDKEGPNKYPRLFKVIKEKPL